MRHRSLLLSSLALAVVGCRSDPDPVEPSVDEPIAIQPVSTEAEPTEASAVPAPAAIQQDDPLQQSAERVQRIRERQTYLAGAYIERGDELMERADLEGALVEYSQALEVMPSSETARQRIRRVRALLGDEYSQASESIDDLEQRERVRRTQARLEAEQFVTDGDNYQRLGEHDLAVESYRRAEAILRYHPLIATDSLDEELVRARLLSAVQAAERARIEGERRQTEAAREERLSREQEHRAYRENKLRSLYTEANNAFNGERYSLAESLAAQILLYDPGNEAATQMRDIAQAARHEKTNQRIADAYRENWIRTFEELNTLGIPQTSTLEFDLARWREVQTRQPYEFTDEDPSASADTDAILERLSEIRVPARFGAQNDGAPLEEVAAYLQNVSGVNFVISPKVKDELDDDETSVQLNLPERSIRSLLNIITEVRENLRWKVEDGVVKFVTVEELVGGQVLRMYEVRDLIRPITDFPGRDINIDPSGGVPEIDEDIEEREALVITEDSLDLLVRENVSPESWDADPANSLRISAGTMVVNQTPAVQAQIQDLLNDLREATGIMVDIQARFLNVEDNFLEDIGVDFRGLGSPGKGTNEFFDDFGDPTAQQTLGQEIGTDASLGAFYDDGADGDVRGRTENLFDTMLGDEDILTGSGGLQFQWTYLDDLQLEMILTAVSKSERVELVTSPRVLVHNTARSNLSVLNQVAYIQDFDVEIAQAASIADPVIGVVADGVILDVRPVVSADRRFLTLELRPTVATLERPIQNFTTSLGVSGNSVTIQLPEMEIARVRTSVVMPDGATVLLGGLKIHKEQDLRSGVPILNKIPIISFFFERQGTFITNRKLLILLKAKIVIPSEFEPTQAQLGDDPTLQLRPR